MLLRRLVAAALAAGMFAGAMTMATVANAQANCDRISKDYANWWTGSTRAGARLFGGAVGGVFGAVAGEILFDRPGLGAAAGAAAGNRAANNVAGPEWQAAYDRSYDACLAGNPLPYPGNTNWNFSGGSVPVGSPEWYQWCVSNIPNFNPWDGTYIASDGQAYYCIVP